MQFKQASPNQVHIKKLTLLMPKRIFGNSKVIADCGSSRYPVLEKPRQKRAVIQDMVKPLKTWLLRHRHNPLSIQGRKGPAGSGIQHDPDPGLKLVCKCKKEA